jgi:hypothetical protein
MHVFAAASIAIGISVGATLAAAPAHAARFVVEYSCRNDSTLVQLASAREKAHPRIFQAQVQQAVVTGRCKIVRYHAARPTKSARKRVKPANVAVPAKPRPSVAAATVREPSRIYVPAGSVAIRVSDAAAARRVNGYNYFPNPQTFTPVR